MDDHRQKPVEAVAPRASGYAAARGAGRPTAAATASTCLQRSTGACVKRRAASAIGASSLCALRIAAGPGPSYRHRKPQDPCSYAPPTTFSHGSSSPDTLKRIEANSQAYRPDRLRVIKTEPRRLHHAALAESCQQHRRDKESAAFVREILRDKSTRRDPTVPVATRQQSVPPTPRTSTRNSQAEAALAKYIGRSPRSS